MRIDGVDAELQRAPLSNVTKRRRLRNADDHHDEPPLNAMFKMVAVK